MTQIAKHSFALAFALFITALTFQQVTHVPAQPAVTAPILA